MKMVNEQELRQLGKNIRRIRKARGMNQTMLAKEANTRSTTISLIENGLNPNPGWDLLGRIAMVLGMSIHDITVPDTTAIPDNDVRTVPSGLVELLRDQDHLLGPLEDRISLREGDWLKEVPTDQFEELAATDYLLILRQFRQLVKRKKDT